jgi:hypothetical protein
MKKWILAMVLNALVMPGFGYYFLGEKIRGTIVSCATVLIIMAPVISFTVTASNYIRSAHMSASAYQVMNEAMRKSVETNTLVIGISIALLGAVWGYCLIDLMVRRDKFIEASEEKNDE